ncbi:hypothetical protein HMPREF1584_00905 [Gardnerella vaginalis JCP8481A]|nr:hypothetical protein HMPREF1584_00905 [Gardnerella vaginalis JCP8481A]EPI42882.1 hypothetical protein HMPREF1585_00653 [Gardnerella vaginalis JCP8481B]
MNKIQHRALRLNIWLYIKLGVGRLLLVKNQRGAYRHNRKKIRICLLQFLQMNVARILLVRVLLIPLVATMVQGENVHALTLVNSAEKLGMEGILLFSGC